MRIAVCDDEQRFLTDFKRIMSKLYKSLDILTDDFSDAEQLLKSFRRRPYDVVFLDIEMPGMDGLTLAAKLRELSAEVYIVFLTGHVEYAIKGYEVNALRYLTKPADEQKVREVIDYVLKKQDSEKLLWVKTPEGEIKIKLSDVLFIEAQNQNVLINTAEDSYSVRGNISDYEKNLQSEGFFRIHRSYLASLRRVVRINGKEVIMDDGTSLPVSRSRETRLKELLFSYVSKEAF
ncbi:MAG: response regulator transcription factor [Ruminococcus sp.]|nr:response regulator transcription factor [Ruminococcus sp.]